MKWAIGGGAVWLAILLHWLHAPGIVEAGVYGIGLLVILQALITDAVKDGTDKLRKEIVHELINLQSSVDDLRDRDDEPDYGALHEAGQE